MNKEISSILKQKLAALPFIDVLAGMAQTLTMNDTTAGDEVNTTVTKRFPVSDDTNQDPAAFGPEINLSPDSARKSIIFFEDYGVSVIGRAGTGIEFQSSLRLLAWLNREKLTGGTYTKISGKIMALLIEKLVSRNPENTGIFSRLVVSVARIPPQDAALFGRYTFKEDDRQYLRPPFEFFGIDFNVKFTIPKNCLTFDSWMVPAPPVIINDGFPYDLPVTLQ